MTAFQLEDLKVPGSVDGSCLIIGSTELVRVVSVFFGGSPRGGSQLYPTNLARRRRSVWRHDDPLKSLCVQYRSRSLCWLSLSPGVEIFIEKSHTHQHENIE